MGNIGCCLWWLVFGLLVGFLLAWLLGRGARAGSGGAAVAGAAVATVPAAELQRLRAQLDELKATQASETARLAAAHHDEHDALHAELLTTRAQLAKELAAHAADSDKLKALGSTAAAAAYGFVPKLRDGDDDLAIVEGIGPKIADLLRGQGIRTFAQLAATPVARLHDILAAAGPRFKIANHPDTWPRQAELCAGGQWEALRKYQDELTAGVDRRRPGEPNKA